MASTAVWSKAMVLLFLTCLFCSHYLWCISVWSLICNAILSDLSSFTIISLRKRVLVALL